MHCTLTKYLFLILTKKTFWIKSLKLDILAIIIICGCQKICQVITNNQLTLAAFVIAMINVVCFVLKETELIKSTSYWY